MISDHTNAAPFRVLVVDDEASIRHLLRACIEELGYEVAGAEDGASAIALAEQEHFDMAFVDVIMPGMDGIELLSRLRRLDQPPSVVMMTAHGTIDRAVAAMKNGAEEFLLKPLSLDAVSLHVERVRERRRVLDDYAELRRRFAAVEGERPIITRNRKMQRVLALVAKVAPLPSNVLIQGESGTGKELVARAIHGMGTRSEKRFFAVNCAALPVQLLETELFGYEKGAFTGATARKAGYFEAAEGGTIFLDEISEMGVDLQAKLLRVIQERKFRRVGGTAVVATTARVVASTNRNMKEEIAAGRFRQDLFYRLNVVSIAVPPLRERREDILPLAFHFVEKYCREFAKNVTGIDAEAAEALYSYAWAGNVRELENAVESAVAVSEGGEISVRDLPPNLHVLPPPVRRRGNVKPYQEARRDFEESYLRAALESSHGNLAKAARATGIPRQYLYEKLDKLGIDRSSFR